MSSVNIGIVELDYSVNYPSISFDLYVVIPDNIPLVGGKRYELGGTSISLLNPSVSVPVSIGPLSGQITLALDTSHAEFSVSGEIDLDLEVHTYHWHIGPASFQYMNPFVLTEPSWSVNPEKIDPQVLQTAINGAPDSSVSSSGGAPGLHNDAATQAVIRGLLLFSGAGGFIDQTISSAQRISAARSRALTKAAAAGSESITPTAEATTSEAVLIAFALGLTGGALAGLNGAYGLYFTSDGDFGSFGSVGLEIGLLGEISIGCVVLVYWPDAGLTAKECFGGNNGFVGFDAGEVITGGLTIYWPEDTMADVISSVPCGVGVTVGVGGGLPVNFFVGNSDTLLLPTPPPQLAPHGHLIRTSSVFKQLTISIEDAT